ncbi:MAG: hypothetical protein D6B25_18920 [Desulfobulbaceae bacterium]|nr:MAG: hypothetical protein D6B25_18920 [Desulfobulbaceae bacterium]
MVLRNKPILSPFFYFPIFEFLFDPLGIEKRCDQHACFQAKFIDKAGGAFSPIIIWAKYLEGFIENKKAGRMLFIKLYLCASFRGYRDKVRKGSQMYI